jgi:NAD+ synthase (glutamine-hydrolysing)
VRLIRIAAATLNQVPLDWEGNARRIREAMSEARRTSASVLCLPELCITGYGCEDAFLSPAVRETALSVLGELVKETQGLVVSFGLPLVVNRALLNTCALAVDGRLVGLVAKRALAGDGVHYEPRWFKSWPAGKHRNVRLFGESSPLGDIYFDVGGIRIGFEICEDAWTAERPAGRLALEGVDLILNPSASHFAFGKSQTRRRLVLEAARAFGVSYLYANLLGNEAGRVIYDGDALVATGPRIIASTERFSFEEVGLAAATVDVELSRTRVTSQVGFVPNLEEDPARCVDVAFVWPETEPCLDAPKVAAWESSINLKDEEFTRAVALGLFDYLRKSRSSGFVVSSSGGADSTTVACLVSMMVKLARRALGPVRFAERLPHCPRLRELSTDAECVEALLLTVYQATRNSSELTRQAAQTVARAIGSRHLELDVEPMVTQYHQCIEGAIGRALSWETDDVALQNIQARVRAPSVWMLANLSGALLLSTSNRSEAAVGYATMDGDTAGGLSPIAGIDKAFIRRWLSWLEHSGPVGLGAIAEVSVVTAQAPTAELRPASAGQTDEADLMPYDLLDAIERAAIRDKYAPIEVFRLMRLRFPEHGLGPLGVWVERFFVLWSRNQWKRERYAPSFHLDDANLDPKTWCRFPILSGGFSRELRELRAVVAAEIQRLPVK